MNILCQIEADLVEGRAVEGVVRVRHQVPHNNLFQEGLVFKAHRLVYHSTLGASRLESNKEEEETITCRSEISTGASK